MPDAVAHYKIIDRLGAGGLGEVYRARDTRLGRTVAIKVLPAQLVNDGARLERMLQAAREAATLSHPNIAAIFEIGWDGKQPYVVFEYVPGTTLGAVMHGRPLNAKRAVDFATQLADALADAHASGSWHGDVRPETIVITPKDHAKFLNFGLAEFTAGGAGRQAFTSQAGSVVRLPPAIAAYLSPEEAEATTTDGRSEIFSLGSVLFEMLTGRPPFTGETAAAILQQITRSPAPPPSRLNGAVPNELDAVVGRALSTDVNRRYQDAATMAAELRAVGAILDVRTEKAEADFGPRIRKSSRRGRMVAIIVLAAIALGVCWSWRTELGQVWRRIVSVADVTSRPDGP